MFWRKKKDDGFTLTGGSEEFRMYSDGDDVQVVVENYDRAEAGYWRFTDGEFDDLVTWALKEQRRRARADWDCDDRLDEVRKRYIGDADLEAYLVGKKIKVECHERPGVTYWIRWKEVAGVTIDEMGIMAVQLVEDEPGSNWHCVGFSTPIYVRN